MKILFLTGAFPPMPCGVGDYTSQLIHHLNKIDGVVAGVLTSCVAGRGELPEGLYFPDVSRWDLRSFGKIKKALKEFQPDLMHLQYPATFGRVLLPNLLPIYCAIKKLPMVQTWHEPPIKTQIFNALPKDHLVVVDEQFPAAYPAYFRFLVRRKTVDLIPISSNISRVVLSVSERDKIRREFAPDGCRLIVYFGFVTPTKGVESLFDIVDPGRDRLVLLCELDPRDPVHQPVLRRSGSPDWRGKCIVTGHLDPGSVAQLLAVADVAVFPFVNGATSRNGSILAARAQGTLVVTSHISRRGYDSSEHVVYVKPGDVEAFRAAIDVHTGSASKVLPSLLSWDEIACRHAKLYKRCLAGRGGKFQ